MMNELSKEQLEEIQELAGLFFSPKEIAVIMGLEAIDVVAAVKSDEQHPVSRAYLGGKLKAEAQIRKSVIRMAIQGSHPAQTLALKLLEYQRIEEVKK